MCTGVEIAAIAALAGTGMSAYGLYQQGQNAQDMAEYNAKVSQIKAEEAINVGAVEEERHRAKVRQMIGTQAAQMGASGTAVGEGSSGDILEQTSKYGELDAQTIRANAMKRAWGLETQAAADQFEGANAAAMGKTKALGTLLSSSGDIYKAGKAADWWGKPVATGAGVK